MATDDIRPINIRDVKQEDLIPTRGRNFSVVECEWMRDTFMEEFCQLDGKKKIAVETARSSKRKSQSQVAHKGKEKVSQTDEFKTRLFAAFLKRFPYRDPSYKGKQYPKELVNQLKFSPEDYGLAPKRMYDWLQRRKPNDAKKSASAGKFQPNATPKGVYRSDHYKPDADELKEEAKTMRLILDLSQDSHCALPYQDVQQFRDNISAHVDNVLRAMSRIANIEFITFGVWIEGDDVHSCQVATSRTRRFADLQEANILNKQFRNYSLSLIGPHLDVHQEEPAAMVYGNPYRDHEPVFPMSDLPPVRQARALDVYFNAMWRRAGGQGDVPYNLLEKDTSQSVYAMVDRSRMPANVEVLQSPYEMTFATLSSWIDHIRHRWPEDNAFQFLQPRPGHYDTLLQTRTAPGASINYPAESMQFLEYMQTIGEGDREDKLPLCAADQYYISLSPRIIARVEEGLSDEDKVLRELLGALRLYDRYFPVHGTASNFQKHRKHVPFMPDRLPEAYEDAEYLQLHQGLYLPPEFWDSISDQPLWALENLLVFTEPKRWMHQKSKTMVGGPYGCKWPIFLLLIIGVNYVSMKEKLLPDDLVISKEVKLSYEWRNTFYHKASLFLKALVEAAAVLSQTVDERTLIAEDEPAGPDWLNRPETILEPPSIAPVYVAPQWTDEWTELGISPEPVHTAGYRGDGQSVQSSSKRPAESGFLPPGKRGRRPSRLGRSRRSNIEPESEEALDSELGSDDEDDSFEGESKDSATASSSEEQSEDEM
ncbi:ubiquitin specific protease 25 [Ceratobasidium sp. AG-Ba]|nr:ubiquitin specific protease 25 [Ceratobasidium sp. AG-Ba]